MKRTIHLVGLFLFILLISCNRNNSENSPQDHLPDINAIHNDSLVNAVIEIPAGSIQKWELNKSTNKIEWELVDGKKRIVNYIGYPGNYGFIPGTYLSKSSGGDGDPLDIIVLGPPAARGEIIETRIIGILFLRDRGEQDDKIIALQSDSPFKHIHSIAELNDNFVGVTSILQLWFTNYKGPGKMEFRGFGEADTALQVLYTAMKH